MPEIAIERNKGITTIKFQIVWNGIFGKRIIFTDPRSFFVILAAFRFFIKRATYAIMGIR